MKRAFLAFLCVGLLAVAGSLVMAQSDYGSSDQPATDTSTSNTDTGTTTGTTSDTTDPTRHMDTTATDTTTDTSTQDHKTLPATASNLPLILATGLLALGGIAVLRVFRNQYAR
jgi:hypothetical protein